MNSVMRLLEKLSRVRKIADVWAIYDVICSKIPLLDEKDMKHISEGTKQ